MSQLIQHEEDGIQRSTAEYQQGPVYTNSRHKLSTICLQFSLILGKFYVEKCTNISKAALFWDSGILPMEKQIEQRKLLFLYHLITLPSISLANQVFLEQRDNNFPGLVTECQEMIEKYNLPDIITTGPVPSKDRWNRIVK